MGETHRYLGFAFAAADLLFELEQGRVSFVAGCAPQAGVDLADAMLGKGLADLLEAGSREAVEDMLRQLTPGARGGPVPVLFIASPGRFRRALLRVLALPERAPVLSCAVSWEGPVFDGPLSRPSLMLDADALVKRAAEALRRDPDDLVLTIVDVLGMAAADVSQAALVERALQAASLGGAGAARLSVERYALLSEHALPDLDRAVHAAGDAAGLPLSPRSAEAVLPARCDLSCTLRAMRLALAECLAGVDPADVGRVFAERLGQALREAEAFRTLVRTGDFTLHYQPIVDLETRTPQHFEALARFPGSRNPAAVIATAEELGLIGAFDTAVLERALHKMQQPAFDRLRLAVNVSACSLACDAWLGGLMNLTAERPELRRRLTLEVTETAALADLQDAATRLQVLRTAGLKICIDDFGAGAASLDYLHKLPIDLVKIDGAYVRDLDRNLRSRAVVSHIVELCRSLGLPVIAEMVETEEVAEALRRLGVDQAQGWLFGRPAAEPKLEAAAARPRRARRAGATTTWV